MNTERKSRRYPRFSLKKLLIFIAVIAFLAHIHHGVYRQKQAIETIKLYGGKVGYDFEVNPKTGEFFKPKREEP